MSNNETKSFASLPNLFHGFEQLNGMNSLDEITTFLIESPLVCNSYIFFDALDVWLTDKYHVNDCPFVSTMDSFTKIFEDHMNERGWKPLSRKYIETKTRIQLAGLTEKILRNPNLTTRDQYNRLTSVSEYTPDELFARNHDIKFKYKQDPTRDCIKKGDCGFMLRVTAASGQHDDSFNIQLVIDPDLYPDDIHFHQKSFSAENIHLALDITEINESSDEESDDLRLANLLKAILDTDANHENCPITWNSRPRRDGTKKYWCWGSHHFYKSGEGRKLVGDSFTGRWVWGSGAKIRPVVYYSC